jgi:hypothetical protein
MKTLIGLVVLCSVACGGAPEGFESEPEGPYRCDGPEIQQLQQDVWETVAVCYDSYGAAACTVDPEPGCL